MLVKGLLNTGVRGRGSGKTRRHMRSVLIGPMALNGGQRPENGLFITKPAAVRKMCREKGSRGRRLTAVWSIGQVVEGSICQMLESQETGKRGPGEPRAESREPRSSGQSSISNVEFRMPGLNNSRDSTDQGRGQLNADCGTPRGYPNAEFEKRRIGEPGRRRHGGEGTTLARSARLYKGDRRPAL